MTDDDSAHAEIGYARPKPEHAYACGHAVEPNHVNPAGVQHKDCSACSARDASRLGSARAAARRDVAATPPTDPEATAIARTRLLNSGHTEEEATVFLRALRTKGSKRRAA